MKKPELRANNLVGSLLKALPNNFFTVSEVGDTMKIYDVAGETHYFYIDDLEPIPLTEEWLIKFGFTIENTVGGYLKWEIKTSKGRIIKLLDRKFTWGAGEYSDYILYVHQLQNLYFALTGEELTISEPTKQSEG